MTEIRKTVSDATAKKYAEANAKTVGKIRLQLMPTAEKLELASSIKTENEGLKILAGKDQPPKVRKAALKTLRYKKAHSAANQLGISKRTVTNYREAIGTVSDGKAKKYLKANTRTVWNIRLQVLSHAGRLKLAKDPKTRDVFLKLLTEDAFPREIREAALETLKNKRARAARAEKPVKTHAPRASAAARAAAQAGRGREVEAAAGKLREGAKGVKAPKVLKVKG